MRSQKHEDDTPKGRIKKVMRKALEYSGPGSWIYTKHVLAWTEDATIVTQLPSRLRIFCTYTRLYNKFIGTKTILFAHRLYKMLWASSHNATQTRIKINGACVWLDLGDPGSLNAIREMACGSSVSHELKELCADADAFIDIGANQGAMTIIASQALPFNATLIAIEPQQKLAKCIERSMQENGAKLRWKVVNAAAGSHESTSHIVVPSENFGEAHLSQDITHATQASKPIHVTTLDILLGDIKQGSKIVVKIDVEGYEIDVLNGGRHFISRTRPIIILEINPATMRRYTHSITDLRNTLSRLGYKYWKMCGREHDYHSIERLPEWYCDIVLYTAAPVAP